MARVGFTAAFAAVVGVSLTGCSAALSSSGSTEQTQALSFESDPAGATIRTTAGQTCVTPCQLTVASQEQPITVAKDNFVPQTVQVAMGPQPAHSFFQNPPPTLVPNPVRVSLQAVAKPVHHAKGRKVSAKPHVAHTARTAPAAAAAPAAAGPAAAGPAQAPNADASGFPAPPPAQDPNAPAMAPK